MTDAHLIIAGQSNALGYLNNGPTDYVPTARVQIFTDTDGDGVADTFNYMLPGVNTGTLANPAASGPEVAIATAWLKDNPDGVLWLVKSAKGSTGLAEEPNALDWSPASHGEMFDLTTKSIKAAQASLEHTPYAFDHWDGVMFMQGETDATNAAAAAAYQTNLADLVAHMRADWTVENIAVGRIGAAGAYSLEVRQAQWALDQADDHLSSFRTLDYSTQPDGLHYDAAGQIHLGQDFYSAWLGL